MSEEGAAAAAELYQFARDCSVTPWQALQDPQLGFNLAVMRGYYKAKQVARDLALQGGADPLAVGMAEAAEQGD